jgi:hypothetical protein
VDAVGKTNENDGIAVHIGCDPVATLAQGRGGSLRQYNTRETVAGFSKDPNCDGDHQIAEHFTKKSTAHAQLARAGKPWQIRTRRRRKVGAYQAGFFLTRV